MRTGEGEASPIPLITVTVAREGNLGSADKCGPITSGYTPAKEGITLCVQGEGFVLERLSSDTPPAITLPCTLPACHRPAAVRLRSAIRRIIGIAYGGCRRQHRVASCGGVARGAIAAIERVSRVASKRFARRCHVERHRI